MNERFVLCQIPFTEIREEEEDFIKIKFQGENIIECGDNYHSMKELYNHRHALFCALVKIYDNYITPLGSSVKCWKSKLHNDGTMFGGDFIVGMSIRKHYFDKPDENIIKYITYHLPLSWWDKFKVIELDRAPPWDGHTSDDVIERLIEL